MLRDPQPRGSSWENGEGGGGLSLECRFGVKATVQMLSFLVKSDSQHGDRSTRREDGTMDLLDSVARCLL